MVIYMIFALLFLSSLKLHIHTGDAAILADHGSAVSISDFSNLENLVNSSIGEIEINPDGLFKLVKKVATFALVLLVVILSLLLVCRDCLRRKFVFPFPRQSLPFFGAPILRAPPVNTYS